MPNYAKYMKFFKGTYFWGNFFLNKKTTPTQLKKKTKQARQTKNTTRSINSKKPWLHVAIPCEIWTKLHSLPSTRMSPKTTQRKISLIAIHSDKPKKHSAAPRAFLAYPREWQLVQFCALWFLGSSS